MRLTYLILLLLSLPVQAIEPDKVKHSQAGFLIGALGSTVSKRFDVGCVSATTIGALKEMSDEVFDKKDLLYTAGWGCLAAFGVMEFVEYDGDEVIVNVIDWDF